MLFLTQRLIYTINIWIDFVFGSFFGKGCQLKASLFYEFVRKDELNVHIFQNRNWYSSKSNQWFFFFFFLILTIRRPFHRKGFSKNIYIGDGVNFWKNGISNQNLLKEQKQPPVVIWQQAIFCNVFILFLWLRMRSSAQCV